MNITDVSYQLNFGARIHDIPKMNVKKSIVDLKNLKLTGYTALIGADVYTPSNKIVKQDLLLKGKQIVAIDDFEPEKIAGVIKYTDLTGKTITPAILDEHIHGGYGVSFHDSDEASIRGLLKTLSKEGTGGVVATTLPGTLEFIKKQLKILNNIIKNPDEDAAKIYGIHLEGPFLNKKKAGIHPPEALKKPTIKNYKALEPENVKIVTLAPELDKDYQLSQYLALHGVKVSAGHSKATAKEVLDSKATQVTHLFNAMVPFHHRIPTIANVGLLDSNISAEMNSDTSLLEPITMDLIMKCKPKGKLLLISDALPEAGIKEDFVMNGKTIHVREDWSAIDDNNILAGSMRFLHNIVQELIKKTNLTFKDFIRYASINPAKNIGVENEFKIQKGLSPKFSIWDNKTITPEKTFV